MPDLAADRKRLALRFDPARLRADLSRLDASAWTEHFVRQNYDGRWSVLPLRAPEGAAHPIQRILTHPGVTAYVDTPFLADAPYLQEVLAAFACPLESVRLMRLGAGSVIKEHTDPALDVEAGTVRLHVPVVTHPDVEFVLNGTPVAMAEGECWYLRLSDPHRVANRGATDRVHLVLDVRVNDWVRALLA